MSISAAPKAGIHCESVGKQTKPTHFPHIMLENVKV